MHEPSPASTYGETAAGDSIPATPQADGGHGKFLLLFLGLLLLSSPYHASSFALLVAQIVLL